MGEFNVNKSDGGLEQTAGMPSEYPATQVMLSDAVTSVEDALDGVMPRTASGTTVSSLASAIGQLSVEQIAKCAICINGLYMLRAVRARTEDVFEIFNYLSCHGPTYTIDEYRFDLYDNSFKQYTQGQTTATSITITSWILYYQGTPIS